MYIHLWDIYIYMQYNQYIYNMISVSNSNYNVLAAVSYASAQAYLRGNNLTYHTPTRHELMGNFNSKVFIFQKKTKRKQPIKNGG